MLPRFVRAALVGAPLQVYGDGGQTRTFCYVDDTVEACVKAHLDNAYENDVVNIGSDVEMTILQLAKLVIRLTQSSSRIEHLPPLPEGDMSRRCPDTSKMRHLLDRPLVPLEEGVRRLVEHYRVEEPRVAAQAIAGTGG